MNGGEAYLITSPTHNPKGNIVNAMKQIQSHQALVHCAYVDSAGDIWAHTQGMWRYATDAGRWTNWEKFRELPEIFGPYFQLSDSASSAILNSILPAT